MLEKKIKGAWAYSETAQFFGAPIISGTSNFVGVFIASVGRKAHYNFGKRRLVELWA